MPSQTAVTTLNKNASQNKDEKLQFHEYVTLFEESQFQILREYARDGKIGEDWLWKLATMCIQENNLEGMKKLHEVLMYDWESPFQYQTLLTIASSYAKETDTRIFEYMLETGASLYEYDYSEEWNEWEFESKNVVEENGEKCYGVECIKVIKWAIEQGADPKALYEIMKYYEK